MNNLMRITGIAAGIAILMTISIATTAVGNLMADVDMSGAYAVIVNKANKHTESEDSLKQLVKQLTLKQRTSWPGGAESKPFGRKVGSEEQASYLAAILNMKEADLARHWVQQKQKTGATPPRAVDSASMVIKLVQKYDGAFGVVKTDEAKAAGDGVRILLTFGG